MCVAAWMMERACSTRSASGASGFHSRSSAWPSTPASGARKSWATMFTSSLFMRSSSTSRALVRSTAWYSSALRRMIPIPSASVSIVITWMRLKARRTSLSTFRTATTSPPERMGMATSLRVAATSGM